ncbi:hypothetical protein [Sphingomicrobium astaxanthinifaciens]|uniref:hypothetical protein n=1 Tax=Sphingomicrobium astaxanthinifaciens TaxID=1227949 RepID=UPI001FCBBF80|nr:hypothetical protein [Sphingomicrobium astaxanthinifaciens]MCJ7420936.1 hypothetical protein [Sphingomicrobium astaxanthinifaciens]
MVQLLGDQQRGEGDAEDQPEEFLAVAREHADRDPDHRGGRLLPAGRLGAG